MVADIRTVMLIDDESIVLQSISALLRTQGITTHSFDNAASALAAYSKLKPAVVLTDINMPNMNGLRLLQKIRAIDMETPVIMITGNADLDMAIEAIQLNAFKFILKPCEPEALVNAVKNGIEHKMNTLEERRRYFEMEDSVSATALKLKKAVKSQKEMTRELIDRLTIAAELRDIETGAHNHRIGLYVNKLAEKLGLPSDYIEAITAVSPMHDVGKIVIPDAILFKPGPLTIEEFDILKSHTIVGEEIFRGSRHPHLQLAASIALTHHERWDGSGYPHGLKGMDIPLEGRIVMLADQYDALRSHRVYKLPLDHIATCNVIIEGDHLTRPEHFEPALIKAFRQVAPLFAEIFDKKTDIAVHGFYYGQAVNF